MKLPIPKCGKRVNYKKRFWKIFSEYIRRRDKGKCYTCSTVKEWKNMDAGHYVNAGKSPPPLYFNEKNVHAQCTACNRFKHGNLEVYARNLVRQYGANILEELETMRLAGGKWNSWTYQVKIDEYKQKLTELNDSL